MSAIPPVLLSVLVGLIVVGILLWLVNSYIPMEARLKQILNIVVLIVVVLWLLSVFGVFSGVPRIYFGNQ
ncbi:MAG: Thivi_2564 family membrane protein [Gammaproteobacteria bacterium]